MDQPTAPEQPTALARMNDLYEWLNVWQKHVDGTKRPADNDTDGAAAPRRKKVVCRRTSINSDNK